MAVTSIVASFAEKMGSLADAIRAKADISGPMTVDGMTEAVEAMKTGGYVNALVEGVAFTLDASATKVRQEAFIRHYMLEAVNLPDASTIGSSAFQGCSNLSAVSIPSATYIGENAFRECGSLASVTAPLLEEAGQYAFAECDDLTEIDLPSLVFVMTGMFASCTSLSHASMGAAVSIWSMAFQDCSELRDVFAPNVKNITSSCFKNCVNLRSIFFPNVSYMTVANAFQSCYRLTEIDMRGATWIPSLGFTAFASTPFTGTTAYTDESPVIYVPDWPPQSALANVARTFGSRARVAKMRAVRGALVDAFSGGVVVNVGTGTSAEGSAVGGVASIYATAMSSTATRGFNVVLSGLTPFSFYVLGMAMQAGGPELSFLSTGRYGFGFDYTSTITPQVFNDSGYYDLLPHDSAANYFEMPFYATGSEAYARIMYTAIKSSPIYTIDVTEMSVYEVDSWEEVE